MYFDVNCNTNTQFTHWLPLRILFLIMMFSQTIKIQFSVVEFGVLYQIRTSDIVLCRNSKWWSFSITIAVAIFHAVNCARLVALAIVTLALLALEYKIRVTLDNIACRINIPADGKVWKTVSQFALNTSWVYIEADIDVEDWSSWS